MTLSARLKSALLQISPRALASVNDSEQFRHFLVKKTFPGTIGLHPAAIDYKLWDGALANLPYNLLCGAGCSLDVDFAIRNVVFLEKCLGSAAIRTPPR